MQNLTNLINHFKLVDIWRLSNPEKKQFTWRRKNGIEKSRIDFWLIQELTCCSIFSCDIRPALINSTDHLSVSLKIKTTNNRGNGYWKMNNSLLTDDAYISIIEDLITSTLLDLKNNHNTCNAQTG